MERQELDSDAINAVATLAREGWHGKIVKLDNDREFVQHEGTLTDVRGLYKPIVVPTLEVASLGGLVDYVSTQLGAGEGKELLLVVRSHAEVALLSKIGEEECLFQRDCYAVAKLADVQPFKFGEFYEQENFVIALLTRFEHTEPLLQLQGVVKIIVAEEAIVANDNGVAQTVTVSRGAGVKEAVAVAPIWRLVPFRTFREVVQPESPFLLRIKKLLNGMPGIALFEADGGLWRVHAREAIQDYLEAQLTGDKAVPVLK